MATVKEIQNLLNRIEITIDETDIEDSIQAIHIGEELKRGKTIEEVLVKNAEYIDFKKLLIIIIKRRQELVAEYKRQNISDLIQKLNETQLEKTIKFAKSYIKPEELVKVETRDYTLGRQKPELTIIDSQTIVYGKKIENKNRFYEKIEGILPDLETSNFLGLLENTLEDKKMAEQQFTKEIDNSLERSGIEREVINDFWRKLPSAETEEQIEELFQVIDKEKFNKRMKTLLRKWGPYINEEKCLLFYGLCVSGDLERRKTAR